MKWLFQTANHIIGNEAFRKLRSDERAEGVACAAVRSHASENDSAIFLDRLAKETGESRAESMNRVIIMNMSSRLHAVNIGCCDAFTGSRFHVPISLTEAPENQ